MISIKMFHTLFTIMAMSLFLSTPSAVASIDTATLSAPVLPTLNMPEVVNTHKNDRVTELDLPEKSEEQLILVLNAGSSSVKFQVIHMGLHHNEAKLVSGVVSIASTGKKTKIKYQSLQNKTKSTWTDNTISNQEDAIRSILTTLVEKGDIPSIDAIDAIGHRVVHGGDMFKGSVVVDDVVKEEIRKCINHAPLHNPHNLKGIEICEKLLPGKPQVTTFDTAFHQTMQKKAYLYAIPLKLSQKYKLRRYGFHGTSHSYVYTEAVKKLQARGVDKHNAKVITCHLGNGASIAAIHGGKVVNTSMGYTPLEGLMMGTRCGDLDPALVRVIKEILQQEQDHRFAPWIRWRFGKETHQKVVAIKNALLGGKITDKDVDTYLNKKGGLLGISGYSDMQVVVEKATKENNKRCQLAVEMFAGRIRKYIGSYLMDLNGCDAIVFTGGIGEHEAIIREMVLEGTKNWLGINIAHAKNYRNDEEISFKNSTIASYVIPTDEELVIARDTYNLTACLAHDVTRTHTKTVKDSSPEKRKWFALFRRGNKIQKNTLPTEKILAAA